MFQQVMFVYPRAFFSSIIVALGKSLSIVTFFKFRIWPFSTKVPGFADDDVLFTLKHLRSREDFTFCSHFSKSKTLCNLESILVLPLFSHSSHDLFHVKNQFFPAENFDFSARIWGWPMDDSYTELRLVLRISIHDLGTPVQRMVYVGFFHLFYVTGDV